MDVLAGKISGAMAPGCEAGKRGLGMKPSENFLSTEIVPLYRKKLRKGKSKNEGELGNYDSISYSFGLQQSHFGLIFDENR